MDNSNVDPEMLWCFLHELVRRAGGEVTITHNEVKANNDSYLTVDGNADSVTIKYFRGDAGVA